ncbi:hypothetical protein CFter6_1275 [Collimonas fungivorans]|uniref:Uncharacterized protein n=1 Tax=Collimonas fungivorans TaxID=158899 RepID=A0A127P896_9BURK|nr:hypothetical protein CFter6_1275 [Collimonas fungivorans]
MLKWSNNHADPIHHLYRCDHSFIHSILTNVFADNVRSCY